MGRNSSKEKFPDAYEWGIFHLPRELRDQIYHHLWTSKLLAFRHDGVVTLARYDASFEYTISNVLPAWLMASHQLRNEGMEQFYRHAHFTVGEHYALPLCLYRDTTYGPIIAPPKSTPPDDPHDYKIMPIKEVKSDLLTLEHARKLTIKDLCVILKVYYLTREGCHTSWLPYCTRHCCTMHMDVCVAPSDGQATTALFPNFHIIENLFENRSIALQELQLDIIPGFPRLHHQPRRPDGFAKFIRSHENVEPKVHYDWRFLDMLPKNLRRINIGIMDDMITPHGRPKMAVVPLQKVREKCEDIVASSVELWEEDKDQSIDIKKWSYLRNGKRSYWYRQPRSGDDLLVGMDNDYLCSRWEAVAPKVPTTEMETIDSIVERSNVGDSVVSERQTSRKVVLKRRQE